MDNIEITVFDEIKDYKEKIYFFNFRQWAFAILIAGLVIPTYILLKNKIGEEVTSYIVIAIAGVFGFIGFVKIHELPAEKILPYWFRHYFLFAKPIHYMSDEEYRLLHDKKNKRKVNKEAKLQTMNKKEIKELRKKQKQEKILMKAKKKYGITENAEIIGSNETKEKEESKDNDELVEKLSKLTKEEQEILLKLLGR